MSWVRIFSMPASVSGTQVVVHQDAADFIGQLAAERHHAVEHLEAIRHARHVELQGDALRGLPSTTSALNGSASWLHRRIERLAAAVEQLEYAVHAQHHAAAFRLAHDARQVHRAFAARHHVEADQDVDIDTEAVDRLRALQRIRHVVAGDAQAMCLRRGLQQAHTARERLFLHRAVAVGQLHGDHHLLIMHVAPGLTSSHSVAPTGSPGPAHRLAQRARD
jgi:hypothetical protein